MNNKNSTDTTNDDDLEPQLESAVWAVLSEPLPANAIARVKANALTLEENLDLRIRPSTRNMSWSRPWMQVASLAVCLMVAFVATLMLSSPSNAFAQAIERLKTIGTLRYKELVYLKKQEEPVEVEVLIADDGRERRSMLGMTTIHDASGQIRLSLIEINKSATIFETSPDFQDDVERQIKWLERLKSYSAKPDKELGKMTIDGLDCLGFEVKLGWAVYSIWVDAKTNDLVQVEFSGMPKGSQATKSVMKNFEFNVAVDPELFSFDVPQGYESTNAATMPELLPFEECLVEALKGYTELSNGRFPKSISDWGEWVILMVEKDMAEEKTLALSGRLGSLLPYLTGMSHDDYDYTGAGKDVGMKRSIVFWYRNPEKQLRAVYGDFSVATIAEADLPKK